ncbi:LuxR C-terminal-related transcriptional regulator [Serratia sp. OS31]|uniref:helix-turn-helix transcriptional regulator n=1 Tax=Serratia sp. OS31 TaxID=2760844 RepID=UPI0015FF5F1E|nr:LuxR C-terminal-related transcriptional regulator [Serratia sp. OS31]MBB1582107.1 response regulator transcription factor [Serratia sp. OS31]
MIRLKVMVMEPDPWFRLGVVAVLASLPAQFEVCGVTDRLSDLQSLVQKQPFDLLLSDTHGQGESLDDYFVFRREFCKRHSHVTWLMWSDGYGPFLSGLSSRLKLPVCLQKTLGPAELNSLLVLRHRLGHQHFLAEHRRTQMRVCCHLTQKELLVISALAHGEPQKQLARRLGRSEKTISSHKIQALHKLGASSDRRLFHHQGENLLLEILRNAGINIPHDPYGSYSA